MQELKNMFVMEVKPEGFKAKLEGLRKQLKEDKTLLDNFSEISINLYKSPILLIETELTEPKE